MDNKVSVQCTTIIKLINYSSCNYIYLPDSTRQLVSSSSSSAATGNGVAPGLEFRAGRSNPQMMRDLLTSPHLEHLKDVIFRFEGGGVNNEASSVEFVGAHKTHLLTASPIFFQMLIGPNANARTRDDGRTQIRLPREYKAPAFRQLLQVSSLSQIYLILIKVKRRISTNYLIICCSTFIVARGHRISPKHWKSSESQVDLK